MTFTERDYTKLTTREVNFTFPNNKKFIFYYTRSIISCSLITVQGVNSIGDFTKEEILQIRKEIYRRFKGRILVTQQNDNSQSAIKMLKKLKFKKGGNWDKYDKQNRRLTFGGYGKGNIYILEVNRKKC